MSTLFGSYAAEISACGKYRYTLSRTWDEDLPRLVWIMLNPSTADADKDDPTIRRCVGFSKSFGFGGLTVVNLFAYRATKPAELRKVADPVGPENDQRLVDTVAGEFTMAAWGVNAPATRAFQVWELVKYNALCLDCLGYAKAGQPFHPLMVKAATKAVPYLFK